MAALVRIIEFLLNAIELIVRLLPVVALIGFLLVRRWLRANARIAPGAVEDAVEDAVERLRSSDDRVEAIAGVARDLLAAIEPAPTPATPPPAKARRAVPVTRAAPIASSPSAIVPPLGVDLGLAAPRRGASLVAIANRRGLCSPR